MALIVLSLAWMLGVVLGDGRAVAPGSLLAVALGWALLALLARRRARLALLLAGLCLASLGAGRGALARVEQTPASVWLWSGRAVRLEGLVAEEPRWTELGQRVVLAARALDHGAGAQGVEGLVLLELPAEPARRAGERLLLEGRLAPPPEARAFDYAGYLARRGIFVVLERPRVLAVQAPAPSLGGALAALKARAHEAILRLLHEPQASLLSGILLGLQSALPRDIYAQFNASGTSHVLVISGWNISITVAGMLWLARKARMRRWTATLLALGAVALYAMLVGPTPTVVRSCIMGAIVAFAQPLGRRSDPWTALAAACLAMSALDPNVLWDLGFQLSAGAVAGLFACGGALTARCQRLLRWRGLRWAAEPLAATLAAQVFTLPLLVYQFGRLSLIAPLANVAMLPAVPLAMALGAIMTIVGLVSLDLGLAVGLLAWLPLAWLSEGAALFSSLPLASVALPPLPGWGLPAYYVVVVGAMLLRHDWYQRRAARRELVGPRARPSPA